MNRLRLLAFGAVAAATAPSLVVLGGLRAHAAQPTFAFFATTAVVRATNTDGVLGASGGLLPLDSGAAAVDAALDANPSGTVLARPVEPGTSYATVASQLPAGTPAPPIPQAQAAYPGTTPKATATGATAEVTTSSATGTAQAAGGSQGGATVGQTTGSATLTTSGGHQVTAVADAYASGFAVGPLVVSGVRGHAEISAVAGGARSSTATLTVASTTVAGQAVAVDDTGVHAVGPTPPLVTLAQLSQQANAALAAAGISVSLAQPVHTTGTTALGSNAAADSGGLSITITTPDTALPTVGAANVATVTLGRVRLTEADQPSVDEGTTVPGGGTTTPDSPGSPDVPAVPGSAGQVVTEGGGSGTTAPTGSGSAGGTTYTIAGERITPRAAVAALGGWQALTLGVATYAVLALRRRPSTEEHLCPC